MTRGNLEVAFSDESRAQMRYTVFGDKAQEEGFPQVARLFRAVAYAEQVHARNHLKALGGPGTTRENLDAAIGAEKHEVDEMYPAFQAVAELQGERGAVRSSRWALEAEQIHAAMYSKAKTAVEAGKDAELGRLYVCCVCGWTAEGEPSDECPLCKACQESLVTF